MFYFPDRSTAAPSVYELRDRNGHITVTASLRRGF